MNGVTITDHNSILGSLAIAHLPNAFISEEVTTYFPDHPGEIHVLALRINEEKHREIQRLRRNIFDLVAYLKDQAIPHVLAHPLYGLGSHLPGDVFERLLLLFRNFEANGTRAEEQNETLKAILSFLRPEDMERLGELHGFRPPDPDPWLKNLVGGSDDHSLLYVGSRYTEVPGAQGLEDFFRGLETGNARVGGGQSKPEQLAHSVCSIAYQFFRERLGLQRTRGRNPIFRFLDRSLLARIEEKETFLPRLRGFWPHLGIRGLKNMGFQTGWSIFQRTVLKPFLGDPQLKEFLKTVKGGDDHGSQWFRFVKTAVNTSLSQIMEQVFQDADAASCGLLPLLPSIGSAGTFGLLAGPYMGSYAHAAADRRSSRQVLENFFPSIPGKGRESLIGCFYDTPEGGLARSLFSAGEHGLGFAGTGLPWTGITCHGESVAPEGNFKVFRPVGRFVFGPDPVPPFPIPPFLDLLQYSYESNFTGIHSLTPGPMGLAALAIARILRLPIRATLHGGISRFTRRFSGDPSAEATLWKYLSWYYNRMEQLNVPSRWAVKDLARRGLRQDKMRVFSPPVDLQRFNPVKRNGYLEKRFALTRGAGLLYVGWIASENDIPLLGKILAQLRRTAREAYLICMGEIPERSELEKSLRGAPVFFTGPLEEEDLALLLASCDLFVSPSISDLEGEIVLQAQASGLPAVVADSGCFPEFIIPGQTGMIVKAGDASGLFQAMETLTLDAARRQRMARAARRHMEERNVTADFPQTLF
ncbi:MAG: glycosyltransferase [Syntrophaceae bacterium]|nr:glycosyltransferase [Syntrophaceae bacterium]